jgi:NAD(P)-dependent dehydrogenase (short-subunit alcohol dehydrogenase family)
LRQFGIDVSVIQPGAIKSEWESIAADSAQKTSGEGPYARFTAATVKNHGETPIPKAVRPHRK